ncbi:hypothetical protein JMJ77_0009507 [Colletotrichum scovillei]|uniref:Uncharacterized protein n=1 Tax=Colletotrichum scovillei TaxID=1209932 RepID=A0A9P7QXX8_9PEZI|nr:hypothetical protein JMJ77_0009507 [Colletotrichum scovillei]KAG7052586.1 hypothetical protein JMJ78_0005602 [Colletotrichum scovillei]KAG7064877.1 hypothetical protein JMJ76_0012635 [Colletotrichum scovillei]
MVVLMVRVYSITAYPRHAECRNLLGITPQGLRPRLTCSTQNSTVVR